MKIIGLTGGSGTGKGTVAAMLRTLGAASVDADAVYHRLCRENHEMLAEIAEAFGDVLDNNGALNRKKLAPIVFAAPQKLAALTRITTPYIRDACLAEIEQKAAYPIVLLDAPTLYETGLDSICSRVIAVLADTKLRMARIMKRDGLTPEQAHARIAAQPQDDFYTERGAHLIQNNGDFSTLSHTVQTLYQTLI